MKFGFGKGWSLAMAFALIVAMAIMALAPAAFGQRSVLTGLQVGAGGEIVKGGHVYWKQVDGTLLWHWTPTTGTIAWTTESTSTDAFALNLTTLTTGNGVVAKVDSDILTTGAPFGVIGGSAQDAWLWKVIDSGIMQTAGGTSAIQAVAVTTAAGNPIGITAGAGNGGTTAGYAGGAYSDTGGGGSAGTTTGGVGGANAALGGAGGTTTTGTGGAGGASSLTSGAGGTASGAGTGGAGGAAALIAGDGGGTSGGTGGVGGAVNIYSGNAGGSAADGAITVKVGGASGTIAIAVNATGQVAIPVVDVVAETTGTRGCTSADYGKTILMSYAGAVAVTLPANGATAGSWIRFIDIGTDSTAPTIAAATADTLITVNDAAADSVTFGSGSRIGSSVLCISTGTYWVAINQSVGCTMTVATN